MDELDKFHTVDILNELKRRYACLNKPEGNYIFFGPTGAGKTTAANLIRRSHCYCHISTTDLFNNLKKSNKLKSKDLLESDYKTDEQLYEHLEEAIQLPQCRRGFIIDGFVNSEADVSKVDAVLSKLGVKLNGIINFEADDQTLEKRVSNRLVHANSGRIYNKITMPPNTKWVDDITRDDLVQSSEDQPSAIKERLQRFRSAYSNIIKSYSERKLVRNIDATMPASQIEKALNEIIEETAKKN